MSSSYQQDYYKVIGVDSKASYLEIKEAYRKLAFRYHPDRNINDSDASSKMKALNEAFSILSDSEKRKRYDLLREQYGSSSSKESRDVHGSYGRGFRSYKYHGHGFTFKSYKYSTKRKHKSVTPPLSSLCRSGFAGKLLELVLKKKFRFQTAKRGKDLNGVIRVNPRLARLGGRVSYSYRKRQELNILIVDIPAGIKNGQTIRLREMGSPGRAGGSHGDLLLKIKVQVPLSQKIRGFFN